MIGKCYLTLTNARSCTCDTINTCPEYILNGTKLENVSEEKDFGVIVSDDVKWENSAVI